MEFELRNWKLEKNLKMSNFVDEKLRKNLKIHCKIRQFMFK